MNDCTLDRLSESKKTKKKNGYETCIPVVPFIGQIKIFAHFYQTIVKSNSQVVVFQTRINLIVYLI